MTARSILALQITLICVPNVLCFQHESHTQAAVANRMVVDGSKTPELISDETALRAFFITLAEPKSADDAAIGRLRAKVAQIGLTPEDASMVIAAAQDFHGPATECLRRMRDANSRPGGPDRAAYMQAYNDVGQAIRAAYNGLLLRLSPEGREKLASHLQYVKTRIRIIPPPDMSK